MKHGPIRPPTTNESAQDSGHYQRFYQAYDRDPASFVCGGATTFNVTDGIIIDW